MNALNDDDEDLRDIASSIEATIAMTVDESRGNRPLAPFAATSRLMEYLSGELGTDLTFQSIAVKTIAMIQDNADTTLVDKVPFCLESKIRRALRTSDELFEEEKQNLYSDDVRNIKTWTGALKRIKREAMHICVLSVIVGWASQGLEQAIKLLDEQGQDGPLGVSWKPEIVTLITGILACSELVLVWASDSEKTDVREKIFKLHKTANRTGALGSMLQHMQSVLMDNLWQA